jgi:4-hydroxybenzoate polyprenyltransferase/phosphoserine phosphatase
MTGVPLVVDLDGTLLRSDLLIESFFEGLLTAPVAALKGALTLRKGKAMLKCALAHSVEIDPALLPYDASVLTKIKAARAGGSEIYLASASHEKFVRSVATYLGLFDGLFATNESCNLCGPEKARVLEERFGRGGFDYIGNDEADLAIWQVADKKLAVRPSGRVVRALLAIDPQASILVDARPDWREWIKLLRVHQYVKNVLLLVPLLTSHQFDARSLLAIAIGIVAFSLCASAVYVLNDLFDLAADRKHPTKSKRPLASGMIPIRDGVLAVPVLLLASATLAFLFLPTAFFAVLALYIVATTAYSLSLKRTMLVDVIMLAALYTVRVIAGAAAIGVEVSEWLLAFAMFFFTSLALIKRYVELASSLDANRPDPPKRNYRASDLSVVAALAAAAGFNAITVLALYISSNAVNKLYAHPKYLWLICPLLMYWIARALMMAHRRYMADDPVIFAMKDRNSLLAAAIIVVLGLLATI